MRSQLILPVFLAALLLLGGLNFPGPDQAKAQQVTIDLNAAKNGTPAAESPVQWITIEEALKRNEKKKSKRPILIDFYTDWCGWCKRMDANTFSHPEVAGYLNENYWPVKFDAESKDPVEYMGKVYEFRPGGRRGTNELAIELAAKNGRIGYPTITLLDASSKPLKVMPGYKTPEKLDEVLKYYGEGYHENFDFAAFLNFYESPISD